MDITTARELLDRQVKFAIESATARLSRSLGTSWHLVGDRESPHDTVAGPATFSRRSLRAAVIRMANISMPRNHVQTSAKTTLLGIERLAGMRTDFPFTAQEVLENTLSIRRLLSAGSTDLETAKSSGRELRDMFTAGKVPETFLTNASWETLDHMISMFGASLPPRYRRFCESAFFDIDPTTTPDDEIGAALYSEIPVIVVLSASLQSALDP